MEIEERVDILTTKLSKLEEFIHEFNNIAFLSVLTIESNERLQVIMEQNIDKIGLAAKELEIFKLELENLKKYSAKTKEIVSRKLKEVV